MGVKKMRAIYGGFGGLAAFVLGAAGAVAILSPASAWSGAASAAPARGPSSGPLRPLSEADLTSTRQTGCTCSFDRGRQTLVQAIGNELMVRTAAGRKVCRISDAQYQQLAGGNAKAACGGLQMNLRSTGRSTSSIESDSSSGPAALTVVQGKSQTRLNGSWGCAC
jgi:hypothetical protein